MDINEILNRFLYRRNMKIQLKMAAGLKKKIKTQLNNKTGEDEYENDVVYEFAAFVVEAMEKKEKTLILS